MLLALVVVALAGYQKAADSKVKEHSNHEKPKHAPHADEHASHAGKHAPLAGKHTPHAKPTVVESQGETDPDFDDRMGGMWTLGDMWSELEKNKDKIN